MDFDLTEEQRLLKDSIKRYLKDRIAPIAAATRENGQEHQKTRNPGRSSPIRDGSVLKTRTTFLLSSWKKHAVLPGSGNPAKAVVI